MDKNKKDPLRPKEDVRITDKEKGFLNTLEEIVGANDDICPTHGLKSAYKPPSILEGTTLFATYECPEGHTFTVKSSVTG